MHYVGRINSDRAQHYCCASRYFLVAIIYLKTFCRGSSLDQWADMRTLVEAKLKSKGVMLSKFVKAILSEFV